MRVVRSDGGDLRREHGSERLGVRSVVDRQHGLHALDLRGFGGNGGAVGREHGDVDLRAIDRAGAGHALGGGGIELAAGVFGDDENLGHQTSPFCFSAATSSATSFTITPLERAAGGSYLVVLNCGAVSTPREAIASVSSGFFFAFMMSGSFT